VNIPKVAVGSGPPVVIVTTIDPRADPSWVTKIKANRNDYAKKHGTSPPSPSTRVCVQRRRKSPSHAA
jgi:mannan polymerase II complex MNN11 subunit